MSKDKFLKSWTSHFAKAGMPYPSEYVIRIFKGSYPRLNLKKELFIKQKICDIGCGSGNNLALLKECGFDIYGVEITKEIVDIVKRNLNKFNISADIRVGFNHDIPFDDNFFDYLLSWNACYYMGTYEEFNDYVKEYARALKPEGYLILSIPKKTCFIYFGSEILKEGYAIVRNDPFNVRNGDILRIFEDEAEIESTFGRYFTNFVFADVHDDCFGYDYHWHLAVCQNKTDIE
jgi:SAM-dependent methyltransferase